MVLGVPVVVWRGRGAAWTPRLSPARVRVLPRLHGDVEGTGLLP